MNVRKFIYWGGEVVIFAMWAAFWTAMSGSLWWGLVGAGLLTTFMFITDKMFNVVKIGDNK